MPRKAKVIDIYDNNSKIGQIKKEEDLTAFLRAAGYETAVKSLNMFGCETYLAVKHVMRTGAKEIHIITLAEG